MLVNAGTEAVNRTADGPMQRVDALLDAVASEVPASSCGFTRESCTDNRTEVPRLRHSHVRLRYQSVNCR